MENENNEFIDSQNDTDTTDNEVELDLDLELDSDEEQEPEEDEKDKKIKTLEAQKNHWKKKATEKKEAPTAQTNESNNSKPELSSTDMYALIKADVAEEDIESVQKYAKFEGITVSQALKTDVLQTILRKKAETRSTAQATNTGTSRKSLNQVSDETLLANASKGKLPENDADLLRLIKARKGLK